MNVGIDQALLKLTRNKYSFVPQKLTLKITWHIIDRVFIGDSWLPTFLVAGALIKKKK